MSRSRRFAWYVVTQWTAALANAAAAIALIPFLLRQLGDDGYGVTVLVLTVANFSLIAQFGLRIALGRHMSEQIAMNQNEEVNRLFSSALVTFLAISIAVTLVLWVIAEPFVRICQVPDALFDDTVFLVRVFSAGMVTLAMVTPAWESVLFGDSRFDLIDYAMIADVLLRATGVLVLLTWTDWGLMGWCLAVLGAKGVGSLLVAIFAHWHHRTLRGSPARVNRTTLFELFSLGGLISLRQTALRVNQTIDPLLISAFLGPVAVSFYGPASRLLNAPWPFITAVARQFTPMATSSHTTGDEAGVLEILFRGTRLTFSIGALATVLLIVFAHPLVFAFLGPGREITAWIIIVGGVGQLTQYAVGSQFEVMLGKNKVRVFSVIQVAAAVVNIAVAYAMISLAYGHAWGNDTDRMLACIMAVVVPATVIRTIERVVTTVHVARTCGCSLWTFFAASYLRPLVAFAVCTVFAALIRGSVDLASWPRLIAASLAVGTVWAALSWWLVFDDVDRGRARAVFRRVRRTPDGNEAPTGSAQP